jgi:protocatechuate 3,4-dioxygenase beta subunit
MRIPRGIFLLLAIICLSAAPGFAQTPAKEPTASISGHVTLSGKPAVGITVVATVNNSFFDNKTVGKAIADEDGNYKLTGLPAGRYTIMPLAKAYVVSGTGAAKQLGQTVNVADGEAVTKIDFALVRGGVVTGRITDSEGHPLIGERVSIVLKDGGPGADNPMAMFGSSKNQTDDRGVYRVYGLGPGSYKVSVGQASSAGAISIMGMGGSQYLKTFYPGVQDEARATIIEIKEGTEVANVDITVGKLGNGFAVAGRVIDADSGQPVPNIYIAQSSFDEATQQMGQMSFTGVQSDANGKFRLEGLRSGHYALYTFAAAQDNSSYSEPVKFDVADGDVSGIELKLRRGATIKGVAVIENNSDPAVAGLLQTVSLYGYVEQKGAGAPSYGRGQISADGSFQISGLAPGKARLGVQGFPTPPKGLSLVRTELDGVDQPDGIELTAGAQINGVRLVFAYGTGSVRGDVKLENGPLPEGTLIMVAIRSAAGDAHRFNRATEIDARLHFVVENIPPGNYELVVHAVTQTEGGKPVPPTELLKQNVTVANGAEVKVNLVVDLAPKKGGQQ